MGDPASHPFHAIANNWKFDGTVTIEHYAPNNSRPAYSNTGIVQVGLSAKDYSWSSSCIFTPGAFYCCGMIAMSNYRSDGNCPDELAIPKMWSLMSDNYGSGYGSYLGGILYTLTSGQSRTKAALEKCGFVEIAKTINKAHFPFIGLSMMMFKTDNDWFDIVKKTTITEEKKPSSA